MTFQDSREPLELVHKPGGKTLPYNPEQIFYVSLAETNDWDYKFVGKYTDEYFTNDVNTLKTEDGFVIDFKVELTLTNSVCQGFVNIDKLLDKTFMASAHEYGVRPNLPQTFMAGFSLDF